MGQPKLYLFAISHYCEKAVWAMDHHGIGFEACYLAPGAHIRAARSAGCPASSVPWLKTGGGVVHGSAPLVDWADANGRGQTLTPREHERTCRDIEQRLDERMGVHARRYFYSEAMVDHPELVRPVFTRDLPWFKGLLVGLAWGKVRRAMIRHMDLGPAQREDSKAIVEAELSWLDGLLADGRDYLVGNTFTRADLAAAALVAPLALPAEHPVYTGLPKPPKFAADLEAWSGRPAIRHVREMYRRHRRAGS